MVGHKMGAPLSSLSLRWLQIKWTIKLLNDVIQHFINCFMRFSINSVFEPHNVKVGQVSDSRLFASHYY